jgi:hypothetical protein
MDLIDGLFEFLGVIAVTVSGWIVTKQVRRRMQKSLGREASDLEIGVAQDMDARRGSRAAGQGEQPDSSPLIREAGFEHLIIRGRNATNHPKHG